MLGEQDAVLTLLADLGVGTNHMPAGHLSQSGLDISSHSGHLQLDHHHSLQQDGLLRQRLDCVKTSDINDV